MSGGLQAMFRVGERVELQGERAEVVDVHRGLLRSRITVKYLTGALEGTRVTVDQAYLRPLAPVAAKSASGDAA